MIYVAYFIHIVISIFLILVVLLQQGKGADLSVFGGGASQAAFGARGAATVLHKATVIGFILFILTTLSIGIMQTRSSPSLMSDVESAAPAEDAAATGTTTAPASSATPGGGSAAETAPAEDAEAPADAAVAPEEGAEAPASGAGS